MQSSCLCWLTVSSLIYLLCSLSYVSGKCSGRWAIHACYGGNGKRSGPPATLTDDTDSSKPLYLRQLLLGSRPHADQIKYEDIPQEGSDDDVFYDTLNNGVLAREEDLSKVRGLLKSLLMEKKVRSGNEDFVY
ncbi:hypothetical protein CHS0354_027965 [Potamilus streckersoni]|uniref:Uncharacterized protein n=1 Tax=Potamilus streckersoni TaxID=2493646 RepID=A0AAE0T541_9BIVA|nr:hypothetical protein CHS0354_027965 [Potamilus streckersoni]